MSLTKNIKKIKEKYANEILAFQVMQNKLYNEETKDYLEFIKEKCLEGWKVSNVEEERINEGLNAIKIASEEIKDYNDFVKYLAVFSKVNFEKNEEDYEDDDKDYEDDDKDYEDDEEDNEYNENKNEDKETEQMLYFFKVFYKLFKNKEIDLELYKENSYYYEGINSNDILDTYSTLKEKINTFSKELPKDFYDNEEMKQITFNFLTAKDNDERQEYKKMLLSKLIQYYSYPSIFLNEDFVARAVIFNYYYLVYTSLNSTTYKEELSKLEKKESNKKMKEEEKEKEKEAKPKRHYHIRKTILIILLLLALLLFGGNYGQALAVLIALYYALKGMLKKKEDDDEE